MLIRFLSDYHYAEYATPDMVNVLAVIVGLRTDTATIEGAREAFWRLDGIDRKWLNLETRKVMLNRLMTILKKLKQDYLDLPRLARGEVQEAIKQDIAKISLVFQELEKEQAALHK